MTALQSPSDDVVDVLYKIKLEKRCHSRAPPYPPFPEPWERILGENPGRMLGESWEKILGENPGSQYWEIILGKSWERILGENPGRESWESPGRILGENPGGESWGRIVGESSENPTVTRYQLVFLRRTNDRNTILTGFNHL